MLKSIRAKIDKEGNVKLLERIDIKIEKDAIVTILDNDLDWSDNETASLSELTLSKYWNRTEEEEAWKDL